MKLQRRGKGEIFLKRLSLVLLFSALAFCMLNFTGGNLHSEGQIATNTPQGVQSLPALPSSPSPSSPSPSSSVPLGVKITSHTTGQQVPTGQLTISGTSTDTPNANCEVYTDVNDLKPMQKVAARGPGGNSDYSAWTFTYTSAYSLIKNGTNNLTSKISCIDSPTTGNLTKWNSVNLTGVDGLVQQQQPPSIISVVGNSTNNTGLLISQSAALSTFEPTVATATTASDSANDNDNSDNDNDNSEESNEEENNDHDEQDNEEAEVETATSDDEDDSEEEENDVDLFSGENAGDETNEESANIANEANDVNNDENNSDNRNPSSSEGNNDENNIVESRSASNEDNNAPVNNEENSANEYNMNESIESTNEEPEDEATESETNEDPADDEDECNIGDRGFPFCDGRLGEELFDDEDDDDDECDIGDRGFPFCDGRID
jgi:hypothetical protein